MSEVYTVSARLIIKGALRASGIIRPDQDPQPEDVDTALEALNFLVKMYQAQGYHLWKQKEGIVFTEQGQQKYLLGPGGDPATRDDDFIQTLLASGAAATDTVISVGDATGMQGAQNLITIDPLASTQPWTAGNSAVLSITSGKLDVENGAASAGFADYTLECTAFDTYIIDFGYEKGSSVSATLSIIDPTDSSVLATTTETATTDGQLEFTATQEQMTFRIANTSAILGENSLLTKLEQINKADGDKVGIKLDSNTRHWTNIVSISGNDLTINDPMPEAAASGQTVFTYTNQIFRPLRIYNERTETITQNNEIPIRKWSREEYMSQPTKDSQGTLVKLYYSPQLQNGELYVWQTAADCNQVARFTFDEPIAVTLDSLDSPDFPAEWFNALKWNTAKEIIPEYRVNENRQARITANAIESLEIALGFDEENDASQAVPDYEGMYY